MDTESPKRSLVRKLAEVMAAVERVAKTGHNVHFNYDFARESDITAAVREELAKRSVMLIPSVEESNFEEVTTARGNKERLATLKVTFTFYDGDSGETLSFKGVGQGQDSGDKSSYKGITGAVKYGLLKAFLIPTGDDPEADSKPVPPPAKKPAPPSKPAAVAAPKPVDTTKMVAAFNGLGVLAAHLEERIGKPLAEATEADVKALKEFFKKKKEMANADPDEAARLEVQRQAEASLAAATATERKRIDEQMAKLDGPPLSVEQQRNARMRTFTDGISVCETVERVTLLLAAAPNEKLFGGPEIKALQRLANDRISVLKDALRPLPPPLEGDVGF